MKTLIGHLSQFSVLSKQGELLCTQGLHFILENEVHRRVFESHLWEIAGWKIEEVLSWHAEATQIDGGRPDLEGRSPTGRPVVKIEAKLHAAFGAGQMIGPAYGGYVAEITGSFTIPSLTASAALVLAAGLAMLVRVDFVSGNSRKR